MEEDRAILAGALALDDKQRDGLARLQVGNCVVKQSTWLEAVHCQVTRPDDQEDHEEAMKAHETHASRTVNREAVLYLLGLRFELPVEVDQESARARLSALGVDLATYQPSGLSDMALLIRQLEPYANLGRRAATAADTPTGILNRMLSITKRDYEHLAQGVQIMASCGRKPLSIRHKGREAFGHEIYR